MTEPTAGTARIVVTVSADGIVTAQTRGILGDRCLDYISVLEDMAMATAVQSEYTSDYAQAEVRTEIQQEDRGVEQAD